MHAEDLVQTYAGPVYAVSVYTSSYELFSVVLEGFFSVTYALQVSLLLASFLQGSLKDLRVTSLLHKVLLCISVFVPVCCRWKPL